MICVKIILGVRGEVAKIFREPYSRNVRGNIPILVGVTTMELGNVLENFKNGILGAMGSQLDATIQEN